MRKLTTWDQVESMRRTWPEFRVLQRGRRFVGWAGRLQPLSQTYTVLVMYYREPGVGVVAGFLPCAVVIDPFLHRRDDTPGEPIPHHYPNPEYPELPFLCLYDPDAGEWHPGMSIARTIIPWTIDWLACYEGWLATGEWTGGGHHPDFARDGKEQMTKVAAATGAAPTYFRPLQDGGYTFVDGGVWANNPAMIALVDALTCFTVSRSGIRILTLGCGDEPYVVGRAKLLFGGMFAWRDVIGAAMKLQSQNALGQAGLLIGADRVVRIDVPEVDGLMELDDWRRAVERLPAAARAALVENGDRIAATFLSERAAPYTSVM